MLNINITHSCTIDRRYMTGFLNLNEYTIDNTVFFAHKNPMDTIELINILLYSSHTSTSHTSNRIEGIKFHRGIMKKANMHAGIKESKALVELFIKNPEYCIEIIKLINTLAKKCPEYCI